MRFGPQPARKTGTSIADRKRLVEMRARYPFRLVLSKDNPRPETIKPEVYGHFGYFPLRDGTEWMFHTRSARQLFQETYGGTFLGE